MIKKLFCIASIVAVVVAAKSLWCHRQARLDSELWNASEPTAN